MAKQVRKKVLGCPHDSQRFQVSDAIVALMLVERVTCVRHRVQPAIALLLLQHSTKTILAGISVQDERFLEIGI